MQKEHGSHDLGLTRLMDGLGSGFLGLGFR